MNEILKKNYTFDEGNRVWVKNDALAFQYSDGDKAEERIRELLSNARDKSTASDELKALQTDWPSTYYFSANRASLLRPMAQTLLAGARVLEMGCGMGAITRYLGETAAEVIAVEGSLRRGSIAAIRCLDLENTRIIIDEIKSLPMELGKFDVVTLIGVLEYARRYGGKGAELEVLQKAKSFLKPEGALILAIENRLGLKYLGGVPEDHLARRWVGVTGGYHERGVTTWSRRELEKMLHEAGFEYCEQYLALPDYKLPKTIITPEALQCGQNELNLAPILENTKRMFDFSPDFNAVATWESVYKAGLLPDLADSLCFVASQTPLRAFIPGELVNHYGNLSSLPNEFAKLVKIRKENGQTVVCRQKLHPEVEASKGDFYQVVEDEPYYGGELLISYIRKIAMRPDWSLEEFFSAFEPWVRLLQANMDDDLKCDGNLLDVTPFNIIYNPNTGETRVFDQEWIARKKVPFIWLLYRGFYNTVLRIIPIQKSSRVNVALFSQLFREYVNFLKLPEQMPVSLDYLWWQEMKFSKFIKHNSRYLGPKDFKIVYMP